MSAGFFVSKTLDRFGLFNTLIFSVCIQALCVISMFVYFNPINFVICHFIMGLTNWNDPENLEKTFKLIFKTNFALNEFKKIKKKLHKKNICS